MFIVVEGPNGVGKSTTVGCLAARMRERGFPVHVTTEPTDTPLGRLARDGEETWPGRALALAVAADRTLHVEEEIRPALAAGQVVISDRYVQSSLALQQLDQLPLEEIWRYNAHVPPPSLSCYLHHRPDVLEQRLRARGRLSRLERIGTPARELALYDEVYRFLARRGWRQTRIDCRDRDADAVAERLLQELPVQL
ncbi:dTMP kinase [Acrocarpospora sp. B8E8]|uniref:dTMP kinase n=1 Tax=Acrocarpospora sp. B8E8 TaxID=3153572 RepID=UPI00325E4D42